MSISDESGFGYNQKHAVGTCSQCGGEMVWNVPRLGPNGGYIHKANRKFQCPDVLTEPLMSEDCLQAHMQNVKSILQL